MERLEAGNLPEALEYCKVVEALEINPFNALELQQWGSSLPDEIPRHQEAYHLDTFLAYHSRK
jgi:hypothetical protein